MFWLTSRSRGASKTVRTGQSQVTRRAPVLAPGSGHGPNTPSVCLGNGNQHRLVTLLDIVNKVDVIRLMVMTHCLSSSQAQMDYLSRVGGGAEPLPSDQHQTIMANVLNAMELCKAN